MSDDWRARYLDLADEHGRAEARHAGTERELTRLITRLCVAVSGLDPALDPHLARLRKAAKAGNSATLLRQADELADALVHVSEDRARPGVVQRLFEHAGQSARQADDALKAWAAVAADPAAARPGDLDRLASALREAVAGGAAADARGGLFARLLGSNKGGSEANRLLSEVLQAVPWPEGLHEQVDNYRAQLEGDVAEDAWTGVVRGISDLAVEALAEAQASARSAQAFLTRLSERLEELDQHMLDEVERDVQSHASGQRLGRSMSEEVESLSDSVRASVDLAELQSKVLAGLDRMQAHVRAHVEEESERRGRAEGEAAQLREQLRGLERDTFDLRRQVARNAEQALRDPLTGLPNRRAYDERVAQEQARLRRFGEPLSLLVLDVDDFKKINDTFGHKAGDKALVMIARILGERLRATDFLARFGGEEFVVLLSGAGADDALRLADAMRTSVEQGGLRAHGEPITITLSGGLAVFAADESAEAVFERADRAMYQAKQQGKNRIVSA